MNMEESTAAATTTTNSSNNSQMWKNEEKYNKREREKIKIAQTLALAHSKTEKHSIDFEIMRKKLFILGDFPFSCRLRAVDYGNKILYVRGKMMEVSALEQVNERLVLCVCAPHFSAWFRRRLVVK